MTKAYDAEQVVIELGGVRIEGFDESARIKVEPFRGDTRRGRSMNVSGAFKVIMTAGDTERLAGQLAASAHHQRLVRSAVCARRQAARRAQRALQSLLDARRFERRLPGMLAIAERLGRGPVFFRCGMCREVFETDWTDEEACAEACGKGIDPAASGLVCDDCYKLTPWGRA